MLKYKKQAIVLRINSNFNESLKDKSMYIFNCNSPVNFPTPCVDASFHYATVHFHITISLVLLVIRR